MLTLTTLGGWGLRHDSATDQALGTAPSKSLALLVYLACAPGHTVRREQLVDLLWADVEPDTADHALRQMVWLLRKRLGEDSIRTTAGSLSLGCTFTTDRQDFLAAIERQDFGAAVQMYAGEFLPGFAAPGGAEFEKWADLERRRLQGLFLQAAGTLARQQMSAGRAKEAVALARRARDTAPDNEGAWRLLLEALATSGDVVSLAVEADQLRRRLEDEHRVPEPATQAALRRALSWPDLAPEASRPLLLELVGRERQFTAITAAWEAVRGGGGRHLHITGAAGLGKTRLLRDAAARLRAMGGTTVECRANPGERHIPFTLAAELAWALAQLPGSAGIALNSASALLALDPRLSSRYPGAPAPPPTDDAPARIYILALTELVESVADEAPVALLIDDLHWADAESQSVVNALLARLATRRVLFLTSARPESGANIERAGTAQLRLEPLDAQQVSLMLAGSGRLPEAEWASGLGDLLQRSTEGSPLLIMESLRLALERQLLELARGEWSSSDPVGLFDLLASGGALHQRVADLRREPGWLLVLLATAGAPAEERILYAAVPRSRDNVLRDLQELDRLGLAERAGSSWTTGHDEIANHAIVQASAEQRLAAHTALARALLGAEPAADARQMVHHLVAASMVPELALLARMELRAARAAGDHRKAVVTVAALLNRPLDDPLVGTVLRRLPLLTRLRPRVLKAVVASGILVLMGGGVAASPLLRQPAPGVMVALWKQEPSGRHRLRTYVVTRRDAHRGLLRLSGLRSSGLLAFDRPEGAPRPGDRASGIVTRTFSDSGGLDIVAVRAGRERRLSRVPGDDYAGAWSPDGRYMVISTDRWSNASQADLALIDPDQPDSVFRRLTRSPFGRDVSPLWSPDGVRIAFARIHRYGRSAPTELCIVTVDGSEACRSLPDAPSPAAWASPDALVVVSPREETIPTIAVLDLRTGARREIAEGQTVNPSHAPGWIYCVCRRNRSEQLRPRLINVARPELSLILEPPEFVGPLQLFDAAPDYIETVRITGADRPVPLDASWKLDLLGTTVSGELVVPQAVRWWSSDTTLATIDSTGELRPRRVGSVTVHASAGGWRSDSAVIRVVSASAQVALEEQWTDDVAARWMLFGTPRPFVAQSPEGRVLIPNGDSAFQSGAISRMSFPVERGFGMELRLSTPVTEPQWQDLAVGFVDADSHRPETWDLDLGAIPYGLDQRMCGITYPATAAGRNEQRIGVVAGGLYWPVRAPDGLARGAWYTVRIQVLADGRCGVAINGIPQRVVNRAVPLGDSALIIIQSYSHRTRQQVGRLDAWIGVKPDIDWQGGVRIQ